MNQIYQQQYLMLDTHAPKHYSSHTNKINVIPVGILRDVQFPAARDRYPKFATGFRYFMTW